MKSDTHMPALDGLRGLSVTMVICAHSIGMLPANLRHGYGLGPNGVLIFFVISGYLITSLLAREKEMSGTIRIATFMARRARRLIPAFALLICAVVLLNHLDYLTLTRGELAHALTYTMDYYIPTGHSLEHLWSLSVEEQFYLIWPIVVLTTTRRGSRNGCIAAVLLCPILRALAWHLGATPPLIFRRFDLVLDSLAMGCLLSMMQDRMPKWTRSNLVAIICISIIIMNGLALGHVFPFPIVGISLNSVCAALIINSLTKRDLLVTKAFSARPLVWLGTISYSLYLWQQLFFVQPCPLFLLLFKRASPPGEPLLKLVCALAAASICYYLVEKPLRARRQPFSVKQSRISQETANEIVT